MRYNNTTKKYYYINPVIANCERDDTNESRIVVIYYDKPQVPAVGLRICNDNNNGGRARYWKRNCKHVVRLFVDSFFLCLFESLL